MEQPKTQIETSYTPSVPPPAGYKSVPLIRIKQQQNGKTDIKEANLLVKKRPTTNAWKLLLWALAVLLLLALLSGIMQVKIYVLSLYSTQL